MILCQRLLHSVLILAASAAAADAHEFRIWTHAKSGETAKARLSAADFHHGIVKLVTEDRSRRTANIAELSAADIDYLHSRYSELGATQLTAVLAGPVTVRGTVTDGTVAPPNQNGIPNVIVQAINERTDIIIAQTQTDSNGNYSFKIDEQPSPDTVLIEFVPERGFDFGWDKNLKGELAPGSEQEINKVLLPITVIAQSSVFELQNAVRAPSALPASSAPASEVASATVQSGAMRSVASSTAVCRQTDSTCVKRYQYKTVTRRFGLFGLRTRCVRICVPINTCPCQTCVPQVACAVKDVSGGNTVKSPDTPQPIFTGKDAKRELKRIFDNLQFIEEALVRSELADDEATIGRGTVVRDRILQYLELTNGLPGIAREGTPMYDTVSAKLQSLRSSYGLSN